MIFTNCKKGRHKFEARYHSEPGAEVASIKGGVASMKAFFEGIAKKTYVHDVCVVCGKINRA